MSPLLVMRVPSTELLRGIGVPQPDARPGDALGAVGDDLGRHPSAKRSER